MSCRYATHGLCWVLFCFQDQIAYLASLDGLFALEPNPRSLDDVPSDVILTTEQYNDDVTRMLKQDFGPDTQHRPNYWDLYVYDLVWMAAMNINATFELSNQEILETFLAQVDRTTFYGVTGHVGFKDYNSRWPQFKLLQFKNFEQSKFIAQVSSGITSSS